jgi:RimJ/RimL family protein N-acetyltransferase
MVEARRLPEPHRIRTSLRPTYPADAPLLKRWRAESSVRRHQPLADVSLAQLRAELALNRVDDLYRGRGDKFQWIVLADTLPGGWITLVVTNWEHGLAEIGYALSSEYQRRGLMVEGLNLLLADLFFRTCIERIEARCSVENVASQKVLTKLGFQREGILRGYFVLEDKRIDNYLYAILRDDFVPPRADVVSPRRG